VINDWSGFGQRTTASGSIKIDNVRVPASRLVPMAAFDRPTAAGADLADHPGGHRRRHRRRRPRRDHRLRAPAAGPGSTAARSGLEDPFTISAIGELVIRLHAAEALLERAGRAIDAALATRARDVPPPPW
jgi:alkylation response protein AidB-like acyl-CoA dehydrogenase